MKNIFIALLIVSISGFCLADEKPKIHIAHDSDDCIRGWMSMDVVVKVDDEVFNFSPSCKFSFTKKFETKNGLECEVNAGMCSSFSPKNRIEATCKNLPVESVVVKCP